MRESTERDRESALPDASRGRYRVRLPSLPLTIARDASSSRTVRSRRAAGSIEQSRQRDAPALPLTLFVSQSSTIYLDDVRIGMTCFNTHDTILAMRDPLPRLGRLRIGAFLLVALAGMPTAMAQKPLPPGAAIDLQDQLETGLKARLPDEFAYLQQIASLVKQGQLPLALVRSTFAYARNKRPYPIQHFDRALAIRARERGYNVPRLKRTLTTPG